MPHPKPEGGVTSGLKPGLDSSLGFGVVITAAQKGVRGEFPNSTASLHTVEPDLLSGLFAQSHSSAPADADHRALQLGAGAQEYKLPPSA